MRARRFTWSAPLVAVLILVGMAAPAQASVVTTTKYYSYSQNRYFNSGPLSTCFTANLSGQIKVVFTKDTVSPSTTAMTSYYLVNPKLNVQARNCSTAALKTMTSWSIRQTWWDYNCLLTPSISAGFPWGIQVTATPNCGNENSADHLTTYGAYSSVTQNNSGTPVKLGSLRGAQSGRCFSASVRATVYIKSVSDSFNLNTYKLCYTA